MIKLGFQFVTVGSDQKFMAGAGTKAANYFKKEKSKKDNENY
jgi:hypothetical protein